MSVPALWNMGVPIKDEDLYTYLDRLVQNLRIAIDAHASDLNSLGTMSTQDADAVNIDGGTLDDMDYVKAGGSTSVTDGLVLLTSVTDARQVKIIADDDSPYCSFGTITNHSFNILINNTAAYDVYNTFFRPSVDDVCSCGDATHLWTAVWAKNGTIQTSGEALKKDIKTTELGLDFIKGLSPKEYKWKEEPVAAVVNEETGEILEPAKKVAGTVKHQGFIAEEVDALVKDQKVDFGGVVKEDGMIGLNYAEFIAPMIKAIQELTARVEELESK